MQVSDSAVVVTGTTIPIAIGTIVAHLLSA